MDFFSYDALFDDVVATTQKKLEEYGESFFSAFEYVYLMAIWGQI